MKPIFTRNGRMASRCSLFAFIFLMLSAGLKAQTSLSFVSAYLNLASPYITNHPTTPNTCVGASTTLSIGGTNITGYQWQINEGYGFVNLPEGGHYSGTNTATLTISDAQQNMYGYYRCVASGDMGQTATSNAVWINVYAEPVYVQQPEDKSVCEWDYGWFTVYANNATNFQWQFDDGSGFVNITNGTYFSGNTSNTLYTVNTPASFNGYKFRCVATSSCGQPVMSDEVTLTVGSYNHYYEDFDGDGYGSPYVTTSGCGAAPAGFVLNSDDCDDYNANVNPNTSELCGDGIDNNCDGYTDDVSPGTWLGTVDNNWHNPANWSCATVPDEYTSVFIVALPNQPVISTNAACKDIAIDNGASLTVISSAELDVKGSFSNIGTFLPMGKAKFSGDYQVVPGAVYNDLEIAGYGTKWLSGATTVNGTLTLSSSILNLNYNNLTISSTGSIVGGSQSAFIITSPWSDYTVTMEGIGTGGKTGSILFPVGTDDFSYTPITLTNTGVADAFSVRVNYGVYAHYDSYNNGMMEQYSFNVNRTWIVDEQVAGGSDVSLQFQWTQQEEQSGFIRSTAFAGHYTGGMWKRGDVQSAVGTDPYTISMSGVTSFSPFAVGSPGSTLPVTLLSFTGKSATAGAILDWKTSEELNLSHFDVERSTDGISFAKQGTVQARNAAGTNQYSYTDPVQISRAIYYRLKMVDIDGRSTYSAVVLLSNDKSKDMLSVYPNPVMSRANMTVKLTQAATVNFIISDNSGKVVRQWKQELPAGVSAKTISMEGLAAGVYNLEMNDGSTRTSVRVVKN